MNRFSIALLISLLSIVLFSCNPESITEKDPPQACCGEGGEVPPPPPPPSNGDGG